MPRMGQYDHLNDTDPIVLPGTMDQLAEAIDKLNYGTHRFLSALVRVRRAQGLWRDQPNEDGLANEIEALLNRGLY